MCGESRTHGVERGEKAEITSKPYLLLSLPKVDGLEMIFSASRSRKVSIVAIIQFLAQFEKTYGKEGAEIIVDNCQCTLFGAFAPNSKTAEAMSQKLGKQNRKKTYGIDFNIHRPVETIQFI